MASDRWQSQAARPQMGVKSSSLHREQQPKGLKLRLLPPRKPVWMCQESCIQVQVTNDSYSLRTCIVGLTKGPGLFWWLKNPGSSQPPPSPL